MNTEVYDKFVELLTEDFNEFVEKSNAVMEEHPEKSVTEVTDLVDHNVEDKVSKELVEQYPLEYDTALLYVALKAMSDALCDCEIDEYDVYVLEV